nr:MAG TPA: GUN4-binding protein domain GUN4 [Bacteriophage sp.]
MKVGTYSVGRFGFNVNLASSGVRAGWCFYNL